MVIVLPWLASLAGKVQGGDYAYCASLAARAMVMRALASDLGNEGIIVVGANPGNYKAEIEGPSFQHDVMVAATGIVEVMARASPATAGSWTDWNGTERTAW